MKRRYFVFLFVLLIFVGVSLFFMTRNIRNPFKRDANYSSELILSTNRVGNVETSEYLDAFGKVTFAEDKQYAYVVKTYNDEDQVIREDYYDEKGNLTYLTDGFCSVEISEEWPNIVFKYLDNNNSLVKRTENYSVLIRTFESQDTKNYTDRFYDKEMNPVNVYGRFGISYSYDGDILISRTYLNENDTPIELSSGFATVTRTFYDDNKVKTEMYFDSDGEVVCTSDGHYGIGIEYYDNGKRSIVTSLDENAAPMKNAKEYVSVQYVYSDDGTLEKELYLDINGNPCKNKDGAYGKYHSGEITYYLSKSGIKYMTVNSMLDQFPFIVVVVAICICILFVLLPKNGRIGLFVLYCVFILFKTVFSREIRELDLRLNPLDSYRDIFTNVGLTLEVINNIWLFIPYGMGAKALVNNKKLLVILFCVPLLVELIQLVFRVGTFETADIINNVLGELIGFGLFVLWNNLAKNKKKV